MQLILNKRENSASKYPSPEANHKIYSNSDSAHTKSSSASMTGLTAEFSGTRASA